MRVAILVAAVAVLAAVYVLFEREKPSASKLVLIAVLTALSVAGRMAFFMTPFFKPVLAFAIIAGLAMGPASGFVVGSMTALVSNFLFGQGPWTPFQMLAWGLTGAVAGWLARWLVKRNEEGRVTGVRPVPTLAYGFVSAFLLHGLITDLWTVFFVNEHPTIGSVLSVYAAAVVPDTVLGISTVVFLALLASPMLRKVVRVQEKYGMTRKLWVNWE